MDRGLVSYSLDALGNRQFETSELIRAYGSLLTVDQRDTPQMAQVGTPEPWDILLAELQALRSEVHELRAAVLLIEHKPIALQKAENPATPTSSKPAGSATWESLFNTLDK